MVTVAQAVTQLYCRLTKEPHHSLGHHERKAWSNRPTSRCYPARMLSGLPNDSALNLLANLDEIGYGNAAPAHTGAGHPNARYRPLA